MYYKITNKESEVYKKLYDLRKKEHEIHKNNLTKINEKVGLIWHVFLGYSGQQNFRRTTQYQGFQFEEPEKVCLKTWQNSKQHEGFFVPNLRTKVGREMASFLLNGLEASNYNRVFDILNLKHSNRFTFPFVEIVNEQIVLFLRDEEPKGPNVIEITKREFNEICDLSDDLPI